MSVKNAALFSCVAGLWRRKRAAIGIQAPRAFPALSTLEIYTTEYNSISCLEPQMLVKYDKKSHTSQFRFRTARRRRVPGADG